MAYGFPSGPPDLGKWGSIIFGVVTLIGLLAFLWQVISGVLAGNYIGVKITVPIVVIWILLYRWASRNKMI